MSYIYVPITFVFQPGGTATGNVFTSWAALAARLKVTAGPKIVQIDDSFAPASVPAGVWDMSDTTIEAFTVKIGTPTVLTLPDNAVLKNLLGISTGLNLVAQGVTQPSFQITSPGAVFVDRAATLDNQGTQPIVRLGATDIIAFDFQQGTFIDTSGPLMDLSVAGANGFVALLTNSQAGNNTIIGVLGTTFNFVFDAGAEPLPTNPGFAGTTNKTFVDQAFVVGYSPTTPADWAPPPDNVGTALDQLAARVTTGFGAIIFQPGVPSAGDHVATWAEVQTFVTTTDGKCFVYVDDSVAAAHVPGGSGVTDFKGRGEIRAYRQDAANTSTLTIDDGATLKGLFRAAGTIFIECDTRGATPSLDWDYTPNVVGTPVPAFYVEEFAGIGNAATATQPSIVVPANNTLVLSFSTRGNIFLGAATFFISLPNVNSFLSLVASNAEICSAGSASGNVATGPGTVIFQFDLSTWSDQLSPVRPVFTGGGLQKQLLDIPIQSIIFRPGAASAGSAVATWAEIQDFIATREGQVTIYVDDSIISPALVPGASGITNCEGRVEIRAAKNDSINTSVLQIENGATLRDLSIIRGVEVRCNTQGATPALDFTSANGGNLLIKDFGALSNAATATQPAITIAAASTLFLNMEEGSLILNAPAVPLFSIAATGLLQMWALDATDLSGANPGFAAGAGNVELNYDNASARFFGVVPGTPPPLPGLGGTYLQTNVDDLLTTQTFLAAASNIFGPGPKTGTRRVTFTGCGGGGAGGGGSGASLAGAPGTGGGGGGAAMYGEFTVLVDFSHRIDVVIPAANPLPGAAGGAPGADGGTGQDGGTCYVLDFTTNTILCAFPGGSGGQGGKNLGTPGLGGANFPSGQLAGNLTTGSAGFVAAGGNGGSSGAVLTPSPGNQNLTTFGLTPPGPSPNLYVPGLAGANGVAPAGSGGGGGGQGPFGAGGNGGNGNGGVGTAGGDVNVGNPGSGAGGGAGGAVGNAGSRGGIGSIGQISYSYRP